MPHSKKASNSSLMNRGNSAPVLASVWAMKLAACCCTNPLGRDTAGRDRILLAPARGNPSPIPPERLGAWWRAATVAPSKIAADYYRFQLLTGCRGGEIHGSKRHGYEPIKVGDVDCKGSKLVLRDTKNRGDHKLLLSQQALEIAQEYCTVRRLEDPLFPIVGARKTLAWINAQAETSAQGLTIYAQPLQALQKNWFPEAR
jgi:hypothetical protein